LLAELRFDLESGPEPTTAAKFNHALKEAAEKRVAFTSFTSAAGRTAMRYWSELERLEWGPFSELTAT
jgi:hypothetical protein